MKIKGKLLLIHLGCCLFMAVPCVKALQSPPTCIQQCATFCAAVVANFTSTGTGPLSQNVLQALQDSAAGSPMAPLASSVANTLSSTNRYINDPQFQGIVTNCQSIPSTYCSTACSPSPPKSMTHKQNIPPKKTVPSH